MNQQKSKKKEEQINAYGESEESKKERELPQGNSNDANQGINTQLNQELSEKIKQIEDLTDTFKRLAAEFENYKKRVDKDTIQMMKYSCAGFIEKLLPVLDGFELALKNAKEHDTFVQGMRMIYGQLMSVLQAQGLRPIEALGKKFDPYYHEVLQKEPSDKEEDIVIEEFQKGYMLFERVIRHSKVKISEKENQQQSITNEQS